MLFPYSTRKVITEPVKSIRKIKIVSYLSHPKEFHLSNITFNTMIKLLSITKNKNNFVNTKYLKSIKKCCIFKSGPCLRGFVQCLSL